MKIILLILITINLFYCKREKEERGGHVGPFFHREKFGFSFWDLDSSNNNSNAVLRAKWTGQLKENLYTQP